MYDVGRITGYRVDQDGTELRIFVPNRNLQEPIVSKHMRDVGLWLEDGRCITADQRKKAYATIRDIALECGYLPEEMKWCMKYEHMIRTGCQEFSLSDCSIDTAREFINTLLDVALENGIILTDCGVTRTDDIDHYLYKCIEEKKCAVCGREGEIHHWDTIGMGNDRRQVDDSSYRKICLCRVHHTEVHRIGQRSFEERHKVYGIVVREAA